MTINRQNGLSKPQKLLGGILILFLSAGGLYWITKIILTAKIIVELRLENSSFKKEIEELKKNPPIKPDDVKTINELIAKIESEKQTVQTLRNDLYFERKTGKEVAIKFQNDLNVANKAKKEVEDKFKGDLDKAKAKVYKFQKELESENQTVETLRKDIDIAKTDAEDKADKFKNGLDLAKKNEKTLREAKKKAEDEAKSLAAKLKTANATVDKLNNKLQNCETSGCQAKVNEAKREKNREIGKLKRQLRKANAAKKRAEKKLAKKKKPSPRPRIKYYNCDDLRKKRNGNDRELSSDEQNYYWKNCQ